MNHDDLKGMPFETLIGYDMGTVPLPSIAAFAHLAETHTDDQLDQLTKWIEPQAICSWIMKYHGAKGLGQVLRGIARACVARHVAMQPRTRAMADQLELS